MRRYLRYHEGDPFDLTQVLRTQFALDDAQYFANLEVLPGEPDREAHTVPVSIHARRQPPPPLLASAPVTPPTPECAARSASRTAASTTRGHSFSVEVQAAQVTKYSLQTRYTIPVG